MALVTRENVLAVKEETTAGTIQALTAGSDFIPMRAGTSVSLEIETVAADTLTGDIGQAATIKVGENPTATIPLYAKHSGTEGTEPEFGVMVESVMGSKVVVSTERDTVAGSTTGVVNVDAGEGVEFPVGRALLLKDVTNGYSIRPVASVSTDALTLGFELDSAPASGVNTGKPITYYPASSGHPSYSLYHYQSTSTSGFLQALAGLRTTSLTFEFPTKELASLSVEAEGLKYYYNPITIDATNDDFSVVDDSGTITGSISTGTYKTPIDLASEIQTKILAAVALGGGDDFTCTYSNSTGKFTCATTTGTTLELNCNAANSIFAAIGFGALALTGATSYAAASVLPSITPSLTPSYDSSDQIPVVHSEFIFGDADQITCRKSVTASFTIATAVTDVLSVCAENGVSEQLPSSREATMSATIVLPAYESDVFKRAIDGTTTPMLFNTGVKDGSGNWTPGTIISIYMKNAKITAAPIADQDGYMVYNLEASGFVSGSNKDIYINFL